MRSNQFTHTRIVGLYFIIYLLVTSGCKKEISAFEFPKTLGNSVTRESTLEADDIIGWLKNQINIALPVKSKNILSIINSIEINKKYVENFRNRENLIIIPLKNNYFSQYIRDHQKPLQFLLIVEDNKGNIRRGDIVLFFPEETNLKFLPKNSFNDFFNNCKFPSNGSLSLVNLGDLKQYEVEFYGGHMKASRIWSSKNQGGIGNESLSNVSLYCTEWYMVTTYYFDNGHTEQTEVYLGTTCSNCRPNERCDQIGDDGSGGGGYSSLPRQVQVHFVVANSHHSNESWTLYADYFLNGISYPNNAGENYFTAAPVPVDGSGNSTSHMTFGFGFMHTYAPHYNYLIFNSVSNTVGLLNNNKTA